MQRGTGLSRKTPLKRTGPPKRKTPLKASSGLKQGQPLARKTPLNPKGSKPRRNRFTGKAQRQRYYDAKDRVCERAQGYCEIGLKGCKVFGTEAHHIWPQRRMKSWGFRDDSDENLLWSCDNCNQHIEKMGKKSAAREGLFSEWPLGEVALRKWIAAKEEAGTHVPQRARDLLADYDARHG